MRYGQAQRGLAGKGPQWRVLWRCRHASHVEVECGEAATDIPAEL